MKCIAWLVKILTGKGASMADGIQIVLNDSKGKAYREITVAPTGYIASGGQNVKWTLSGTGAKFFTLVFPDGTPFDDTEIHSKGKPVATAPVVNGGVNRYHYYVAIFDENDDIFLIAGCPEIIIR